MAYTPGLVDYVLVVTMVAGMAVEVALFTGLTRAAAQGRRGESRLPTYRYFIVYQWALVGCIALLWFIDRRPWGALLLGTPKPLGFAVCFALAAAYAFVAPKQATVLLNREEKQETLRVHLSSVEGITPHTVEERSVWTLVAITAGICEETLFRGFLLAFVAVYTGPVGAILITSLLFGLFHAYYGWSGILRTAVTGLVFALAVVWSGSLIPAMIMHVTLDMVSGDIAFRYFTRRAEQPIGA